MTDEKRFALLIDAENISAQYADYIMEEVEQYGVCSYKRIYGSWDRIVRTKWEAQINKNSLKAMMQKHPFLTRNLRRLKLRLRKLMKSRMKIPMKSQMKILWNNSLITSVREKLNWQKIRTTAMSR